VVYDFHTHTSLSDGALSPIELIRRAWQKGYKAIALTDHVGLGSLERVIREVAKDCALARAHWGIIAIPGVELTHLPARAIGAAAEQAKELGAGVVIVHGESVIEPVEEGTNLAALQSPHVDILAHPGLLTLEEAQLAAANGIFLELTARKGHCLTNGHIFQQAQRSTARLLVNSDAHEETDLLTSSFMATIVQGAGAGRDQLQQILTTNPQTLLHRLLSSRSQ
jgi:histidinol phosphatase-like PHP family hydrolase